MNTDDMFAYASKRKLRFDTTKGQISTEDLWDLELTNSRPNQSSLDSIAIALNKQIKDTGEVTSFVTNVTSENKELKTKFAIVLHIIEQKKIAADRIAAANNTRQRNQRIMELIEQKKDGELAQKSVEELTALLAVPATLE